MIRRADVTALVVGLLLLILAGLGLWMSFGIVNWALVGVGAPLALVAVGLLGLLSSRPQP